MNKLKLVFILFFLAVSTRGYSQFYSARTNVIGLATGNLNAEFGMTLNKKFSIHCPLQYNPFVFSRSNNTKFQNLTIMPCGRYWFRESFRDSFIGLSVIGSRYNKGGYKFGHEYGWHVIPHKIAVNLVYLF